MSLYRPAPLSASNVVAASGTAQTLPDVHVARIHDVTLTGNCTFTFPAAATGKSFRVVLRQDGTGSRTATWPAAVKWAAGSAPTLTTTASAVDAVEFASPDGVIWLGQTVGKAFA